MKMRIQRTRRWCAAVVIALCAIAAAVRPAPAGTVSGTVISNASNAFYQDGNSNHYDAASNIVSVIVENAAALTVTAGSSKAVAAGQTVSDSFTITNTGNAGGDVQLTAGGVTGGTDAGSTTTSYAYNGTNYASLTALNAALAGVVVPAGGTLTVSVVYALAATAAVGNVQTNVTATITYAAAGAAAAQTSSAVSAANPEDDAVALDALLDVALSSVNVSGVITYNVAAVDRTTVYGAKDLQSVKALLGRSTGGIFISVKIPQYPANTPLAMHGSLTVATSSANGFAPGATTTLYSTASPTGIGGWTAGATPVANAAYVGVLISGGSCTINGSTMSNIELCPVASAGSSAGVVPNPAVTLTFAVNQSTATGSANAGSTQTVANGLIGSNGSTEYVIGPGIAANSLVDSAAASSALAAAGVGINNAVSVQAPSGASSINATQSIAQYLLANGPFGNAAATGAFDGSTNDINHDFTAVSFVAANSTYATTNAAASFTPTTAATTSAPVGNIAIENTLANLGNTNDSYNLVATAPAGGWTVYLESDNAGAPGGSLGGAAPGATSTAANVAVASGAVLNYWAVYTAPSGIAYLSHAVGSVAATSIGSGNTVSNRTNHLLYAGFVAVTTAAAATTPHCPAGVSPAAGQVCSGGTITYVIDYRNVVNPADVSSAPSVSFAGVMTKAGSFTLTVDGTVGSSMGNNWAATSSGPTAVPVDTTPGTTFAYWSGATAGTPASAFQSGLTKFIATVGGPTFQLVPVGYANGAGSQGTITFSVIAN